MSIAFALTRSTRLATSPLALALATALLAPALASAQTASLAATPATPEACALIENDAQRLACYDEQIGHKAPSTQVADAKAEIAKDAAKVERKGPPDEDATVRERARRQLGAVFGRDDANYRESIANSGKGSLLDSRWELAKDSKLGVFQLRAYKPVYLLPWFATDDVNELPSSPNPENTVTERQPLQNSETKFQISFKTKAYENLFGDNGDIWMAYTQSSRWQTFNKDESRPFRETNYEPEVMLLFRNNYSILGWKGRMSGLSVNHQSNGRGDPLSRSWNRVIAQVGLDRENWALVLRPWYRIPDGNDDDNPDIENYMGRGDAMLTWSKDGQEVTATVRHSLRGGDESHGSLALDWAFPINKQLRGHVQAFTGYGESLIDYNHKATYLGVGISLLEWY